MSLENQFASLSISNGSIIRSVDNSTDGSILGTDSGSSESSTDDITVNESIPPPVKKKKKKKNKKKKQKQNSEITNGAVKSNKKPAIEYEYVSEYTDLVDKLTDKIESAIERLHQENKVEIELKFGQILGKQVEARYSKAGIHPRLVHPLGTGGFDSDLGPEYWNKVTEVVKRFHKLAGKKGHSRHSYYMTSHGLSVNVNDFTNPGESAHRKRILNTYYLYNPTGLFDFKIIVSEKIKLSKKERKEVKRDGRLLFERTEKRNYWRDDDTDNLFISTQVKLTPALKKNLHEFEIQLNAEDDVTAIREDGSDEVYKKFKSVLLDFFENADLVNDEIR